MHLFHIKPDEWDAYLEESLEEAILPASLEILEGKLTLNQLAVRINRQNVYATAKQLLSLTHGILSKELPTRLNTLLATLPGGAEWFE